MHPDAWQLCLGGQPRGEIGLGGLEYVGDLYGDWRLAGVFVGDGVDV